MGKPLELASNFEAKMLLAAIVNESIDQLGALMKKGYVTRDLKWTGKRPNKKTSKNSCVSLYGTVGEIERLLQFFTSGLAAEKMAIVLPDVSVEYMLERMRKQAFDK